MPHPRWLALCLLVLTGCGNPHEKAGRALHQAKGWAATAEAVTSDPLGRGLPPYFVARTLAIGADAVGQHAQTIESLGDLSEPERRSSADAVRQLAAALRASASHVERAPSNDRFQAALVNAYAAVMARARTYPR